MKKILSVSFIVAGLFSTTISSAQMTPAPIDPSSPTTPPKPKPPVSPPAQVTAKLASGATITINYSKPSVKGRTIGKDLEPMDGKVWRTGANDATTFETDKDITVNGKKLAAGKYGLFTLFAGNDVSIIFNATWKQWGAFKYDSTVDVIRVNTKMTTATPASEAMTFTINGHGAVDLLWGNRKVEFTLK